MEPTELKEIPPYHTGSVPPAWALAFCETDLEHLRQFYLRFGSMDATQHSPLAADKLVGQALHLARMFPDADTCRAILWLHAIESLSPDQRTQLVFPRLTESAAADSLSLAV